VSFAGNFIVAWKRGIAIISAGTVKVTPDSRVKLTNNYGLEIDGAVPQDAGDYICQIATLEPREITHTVEILGKFVTFHLSLSLSLVRARKCRFRANANCDDASTLLLLLL
jgi:hypothetical protein